MLILLVGLIATAIYYASVRLAAGNRATPEPSPMRAERTVDDLESPEWTARDERRLTRLLKNSAP